MTYIQPNPNGSATSANSSPVVIASDQATVPVSLASVPSHAVTNAGTFAVQATGTVTANAGTGTMAVSAASLPLPTGAAADATLTGGTQKTKLVDTGGTNVASISAAGALKVDNSAVTQPVSAASLPLPTGAAQDGTDITTPTAMPAGGAGIRGWLSAIWTKLNGSIAVTGTFWQATQPVSIATMPSTPVTGTFWQATQPVSLATNTPTIAAGSAIIGKVGIDQTTPGTTNLVALAANQSVNNAQIAGVATSTGNGVAGTGVQRVTIASDNTAFAVNATVTQATGTNLHAVLDTGSTTAVTQATGTNLHTVVDSGTITTVSAVTGITNALPAGTNLMGKVGIDQTTIGTTNGVTPVPSATGGPTLARVAATASTNATSVKVSAGQVYGWALFNNTAAAKYVKLYNKASAPTVGTDVPVLTIIVPASSGTNISWDFGMPFGTGIAYAITGAVADTDTTAVAANDIHGGLLYK